MVSISTVLNKLFATFKSARKSSGRRHRVYRRNLCFDQLEDRRLLAVLTVNSALDNTIGGDGLITLREALDAANQSPGPDTIEFDSSLNGGTILLTQDELSITESLTIDASMLSNGIAIDAGGNGLAAGYTSRIFNITDLTSGTAPPEVTLIGLTLTGGDVASEGGANVDIQQSKITGNHSDVSGGLRAIFALAA